MALSLQGDTLREGTWSDDRDHEDPRMNSETKLPFAQWADIHRTDKFICFEPRSGYRRVLPEYEDHTVYLPCDASVDVLGQALLDALDRSRFIWPPDEPQFFQAERILRSERDWQANLMRRYDYRNKRDAYKNMNWCRTERSEGKVSIQPHKRDEPGYWENLPPEETVIIAATNDPNAVGAALNTALDRCK
jgi:hypothetical protein